MPVAIMEQVTGKMELASVHVADDATRVFCQFIIEQVEIGPVIRFASP